MNYTLTTTPHPQAGYTATITPEGAPEKSTETWGDCAAAAAMDAVALAVSNQEDDDA